MKWITEEDVSDEWMIQSPPTHTGSSILLKGFPFFYVRWGVRQSGTYLERGAPAPAADTVTMLTSSDHCRL